MARAVGHRRRLRRVRGVLPASPRRARAPRRGRIDRSRRAGHAPRALGVRRRRRGFRVRLLGCRVARAARALPAPAGPDRRVRPRPGRPGRSDRHGFGIPRRPRRSRARSIAQRGPRARVGGGTGRVPARTGRGDAVRDHRDGQDRRARAELRQRRRRHLRRRIVERGRRVRGARDRHRYPSGRADDARHLRSRDRTAPVGGRSEPAPRGQAGRVGAQPRFSPSVLRPVGEELGVPGALEGASDRGRLTARGRVRLCDAAPRLAQRGAGELRRGCAAHARARDRPHPRERGEPSAEAGSRGNP
ncbi:MAG: hypothetical protein K0R81_2423 [Microbacterium sp.]|nr:hypothetical protein [Microbacterium sp.]